MKEGAFDLVHTAEKMERAYRELLEAKHPRPGVADPGFVPRVLFSPVSGPGGAGELMRGLIIARELARAEPAADIRFLVSHGRVPRVRELPDRRL